MKKLIILAAILIVLVVVAIVVQNNWKSRRTYKENSPIPANVTKNIITRLEIINGKDTVEVRKTNGKWYVMVNGEPREASQEAIEKRLDILVNMKGEVVSKNPQNFDKFGVTDKAEKVIAYNGNKKLVELYIGNTGPTFTTTYVRNPKMKEVFLVKSYLKSPFTSEIIGWRERRIFKFKPGSIVKFTYIHGKDTLSAELKDSTWVFSAGKGDTFALKNALNAIRSLSAMDFEDKLSLKDAGLEKPEEIFEITLKDGSTYRLLVGKHRDKNSVYVKREDKDQIYITSTYMIKKFEGAFGIKGKKKHLGKKISRRKRA